MDKSKVAKYRWGIRDIRDTVKRSLICIIGVFKGNGRGNMMQAKFKEIN